MEEVPKIVTQRLRAAKPEAHLDVNLLAAFAEKSLTSREQAQVLEHLAGCALCRDVVAHAHSEPAMQQVAAAPAKKRQPWFRAAALRWGALAACVAIVGTLVIGRSYKSKMAPMVEIASNREVISAAKTEPAAPPPSATSSNQVALGNKKANGLTTRAERDTNQLAWSTPQPVVSGSGGARNEKVQAGADLGKNLDEKTRVLARQRQDALAYEKLDGFAALQPGAAASATPNMKASEAAAVSSATENKPAASTGEMDLARVVPPSPQAAPKLAGKAADAAKAPAVTSQAVTVAGAVPAVALPHPPAPAKVESASVEELPVEGKNVTVLPEQQKQTTQSAGGMLFKSKDKEDEYRGSAVGGMMRAGVRLPLPRWQLSADGKLLRSNDAGDSWQSVLLADNVVFRALSVTGPELWVGGVNGALFHSSDAGGHWEPIKPVAHGKALGADITTLEFADPKNGKLTTADRQTWATSDGGRTWQHK